MGNTKNTYRILMGKFLVKCSLQRLNRWEDNIKMNLTDLSCEDGQLIELAQGLDIRSVEPLGYVSYILRFCKVNE
jgi:hypothetical protein